MSQLSPARRALAITALALGGFAIGSTEFVAMGLLPNIAQALLPAQYGADPDAGIAHAGWLVSAYALGVVVGAPTIAAMSAKFPRKGLLLVLLIGFVVATVASALLPSFGMVLVARFVAGLPHGAYFGIASIVAGDIMGPGKRGKGIAMVLLGLSVANVVGVPAITWVGQNAGWRVAYGVVAVLFVATFLAVAAFVPRSARDQSASIGRELRAFRVPQVWLVMGLGAVGFGGFFAVYSYISPLVTNVTGLPEGAVPLVLVVVGLGMVVGGVLGGHLADRSVKRTIYIGMLSLILSLLFMVLTAQWTVGRLRRGVPARCHLVRHPAGGAVPPDGHGRRRADHRGGAQPLGVQHRQLARRSPGWRGHRRRVRLRGTGVARHRAGAARPRHDGDQLRRRASDDPPCAVDQSAPRDGPDHGAGPHRLTRLRRPAVERRRRQRSQRRRIVARRHRLARKTPSAATTTAVSAGPSHPRSIESRSYTIVGTPSSSASASRRPARTGAVAHLVTREPGVVQADVARRAAAVARGRRTPCGSRRGRMYVERPRVSRTVPSGSALGG